MKRAHKITAGGMRAPDPDPADDRYQAELDRARNRAEKAWRQAERRAQKAHERQEQAPTKKNRGEYERVLAEAERLRDEFERLEQMMRQAPVSPLRGGAGKARHRAGRDDHLEQGVFKDRRSN